MNIRQVDSNGETIESQSSSQEEVKASESKAADTKDAPEVVEEKSSLKEEDVFAFLSEKTGREINSLDSLIETKEVEKVVEQELPDAVKGLYDYMQSTGRTVEDWIQLQSRGENMDEDELLTKYTMSKYGLDSDEARFELQRFATDEDDEDDEARAKTIERKKLLNEAKAWNESEVGKYKVPLESSVANLSEEDRTLLAEAKSMIEQQNEQAELNQKKTDLFLEKSTNLFTNFEGFKIEKDGHEFAFKPADGDKMLNSQLDTSNFIKKFLDGDGMIKDAEGYHKALAVAMNLDAYTNKVWEEAVAFTKDSVYSEIKNSDKGVRAVPDKNGNDKPKIRKVTNEDDREFKIKRPKFMN